MILRINHTTTKGQSLQSVTRFTFTILIAIITSLGAFALVGCGGDEQPSQSAATQAAESSSASADSSSADSDDDQDNCYGNDLPAVKK